MSRWRRIFVRVVLPVILSAISLAITYVVFSRWVKANEFEFETQKLLVSTFSPVRTSDRILLLTITGQTFAKVGLDGMEKSQRVKVYTKLVEALEKSRAKVLFIDTMFGKSPFTLKKKVAKPEFIEFQKALARLSRIRVTLATNMPKGEEWDKITGPLDDPSEPNQFRFYSVPLWAWPGDATRNVNVGYTECAAIQSGYIGGLALRKDWRTGKPMLFAPLSAVLQIASLDFTKAGFDLRNDQLIVGNHRLDVEQDGLITVELTDELNPFQTIDAGDAISALKENPNDPRFDDKLCIVGDLTSTDDLIQTSKLGQIQGVYFMAHMTNTILHRMESSMNQIGPRKQFFISFLIVCAAAFALFGGNRKRAIFGVIAAIVVSFLLPVCLVSFAKLSMVIVYPITSIGLLLLLSLTIQSLAQGNLLFKVPGESAIAAVLFADIHESTQLVQRIGSVRYQALVSEFVALSKTVIERHHGTIERATGDGWMAIFEGKDEEALAKNALAVAREIFELYGENKEIEFSFGLESGQITGGYVYEASRKTWSSAGIPVNTAQRAQGFAKSSNGGICMGPSAGALLKKSGLANLMGDFALKGFEMPVKLYETTL